MKEMFNNGKMAEWLKAVVLKTTECKSSKGSNPFLSAKKLDRID
jgi:hypothetical protein